jgi:predicted PurR-regulated permease PerM
MEILVLVFIVSVVIILVLCWPRINESIAAQQREFERQREEEERKRQAFLRWYESLPDEEKYLIDQQLAQINSMRAMQAMMGFHIMHEWMEHGDHTDSHFPFV